MYSVKKSIRCLCSTPECIVSEEYLFETYKEASKKFAEFSTLFESYYENGIDDGNFLIAIYMRDSSGYELCYDYGYYN